MPASPSASARTSAGQDECLVCLRQSGEDRGQEHRQRPRWPGVPHRRPGHGPGDRQAEPDSGRARQAAHLQEASRLGQGSEERRRRPGHTRQGCKIVDEKGKPITDSIAKVSYPHKGTLSRADFLAHAEDPEEGENSIAYFYQDRGGNVTVGIGHLVADEAEARRLAKSYFFFRLGGAKITEADVVDAFRAARDSRAAKPGTAHTFENVSDVRLERQAIIDLFDEDVDRTLAELKARKEFRDFATYPPAAKLGLLDMAFTLGVHGVWHGYPIFTSGVVHRDWEEAAAESNRPGVSSRRNLVVRAWFRQAARREPFFLRSPLSKSPSRKPCTINLDKILK